VQKSTSDSQKNPNHPKAPQFILKSAGLTCLDGSLLGRAF
jgi:hypothetical protein